MTPERIAELRAMRGCNGEDYSCPTVEALVEVLEELSKVQISYIKAMENACMWINRCDEHIAAREIMEERIDKLGFTVCSEFCTFTSKCPWCEGRS